MMQYFYTVEVTEALFSDSSPNCMAYKDHSYRQATIQM